MKPNRLLPGAIKIKLHLFRRGLRDLFKGQLFSFAKRDLPGTSLSDYPHFIEIRQEIKLNSSTMAKKTNLLLAIASIEQIRINPGEVFSFWKAVGNPSAKKGYVASRSLIGGVLRPSVGGGLCQLSGLIYYISLRANLEIMERSCHSADIYTEETRFTPLGSDATVVYGYKDLRMRNNLHFPLRFSFTLTDEHLTARLTGPAEITESNVEFRQLALPGGGVEVITLINDIEHDRSKYDKVDA